MIDVSYMQNIYTRKEDGERRLHRGHVTGVGFYDSFDGFVADFIEQAVHPLLPTNKEDAFGWTATLFRPSGEEDEVNARNASFGNTARTVLAHRQGQYACDHLTLFCADLDNHHEDRPMVPLATVQETLDAMGLNHVLYTSFSHKPERHKVRIVMPVSRPLTPDEAFTVFTVFNHAWHYQLDGSIYDPGDFLYGPPINADVRIKLDGQPLEVDAFLAAHGVLPEEAKTFVVRHHHDRMKREATEEEKANFRARFASLETDDNIGIKNPRIFKPEWFELADTLYQNGSHWSTMTGLLGKVWLKSGCELTRGDMQTIQDELDLHWCGYLSRNYCRSELDRAIRDAMKMVGTPRLTEAPTKTRVAEAIKRMKNRRKK